MSANMSMFNSKRSLATIAKMLAFITEQGHVTAAQVSAHVGLSENYNGRFMRHMEKKGLIHELSGQVRVRRGSYPVVWAAGAAPAREDDERDDFQRLVVVRKQWEPNHTRMTLDCFLFGIPAVLQEVAA